ncbi:MAG TPA: hypothetical protein VN428_15215 [Bryobacteraceae bacterium]|nr:hypothetical protein [Bryobacteraceae bacterium]
MNTRWLWLVPAVLATAGPTHAEPQVGREGRQWVDSAAGSIPAGPRVKVFTRGTISLHGENRNDIAWTVKKRSRASGEIAAKVAFERIAVKAYRSGDWSVVYVNVPAELDAAADLQVRIPKKLQEVHAESQVGRVEVFDLDGGLFANTGAGEVQVDRIQGWVKAGTGGGNVRIGRVAGILKAYSAGGSIFVDSVGGDAYLETGGGEVVVREAKGRVQATASGGGNIRIDHAAQGAALSTGGGIIDVSRAGGLVRANTGAGSIKVRSAASVDLVSGSGQIQLQSVSGGMQATTAMGAIIAELGAGKQLRDSVLSTQAGDITVYIPSNVAVTVEAVNASPGGNRIVSDFAEVRPRLQGGNMRSEAQGSINGGGAILRLAAQGGTIYLRRR